MLPDARARGALVRELGQELDNLRAAVSWALDHKERELALRLAGQARWFSSGLGTFLPEQARWLDEALHMPGAASTRVHLHALENAVGTAFRLDQLETVRALVEDVVRLARQLDDSDELIQALSAVGMVTSRSGVGGDIPFARAHLEEALALAEQTNSKWLHEPLHGLGELETALG